MLEQIKGPNDLKQLDINQLNALCDEIRSYLVANVTKTGGHLASNLGVVELTVALHYVFDIDDKFVWDVGHQSYVHKLLTGRYALFDTLRQQGGISGFCDPAESKYDTSVSGHAGTAVSTALGLATARDLANENYSVVAVVGDGALTNGETYEALNNVKDKKMLIVLNDNGMSIDKNVGSLPKNLSRMRVGGYDKRKERFKRNLNKIPLIGKPMYKFLRWIKRGVKRLVLKHNYFDNFDLKYVGIVDGHDLKELIYYLQKIKKNVDRPCVMHVYTKKGKGFAPAEENQQQYHSVYVGEQPKITSANVISEKLVNFCKNGSNVVAVSAAMTDSVGLSDMAVQFPDRVFDVGIAEGHAVTFASGLAYAGQKPYVLIYSTFLQRAYDQILHDVAIANLPVTFLLDRAGFCGNDGKTHQGLQDLSYLTNIPNVTVWAPATYTQLSQMMDYSLTFNGPLAIRYSKTLLDEEVAFTPNSWTVINKGGKVKLLAVGKNMLASALNIAKQLPVEVVSVTSVKPLDYKYLESIKNTDVVVTLEENQLLGGFGSAVTQILAERGCIVKNFAVLDSFIAHGSISEQLENTGLDTKSIENFVKEHL